MTRKSRRAPLKVTPRWLREQKTFEARTGRFPKCKGTYPDCPENIDKDNPPQECRKCPKYRL